VLKIECEPPRVSEPCECCGGTTIRLTRFILRDGEAYAVCYAKYSDNHAERIVQVALSIGKWWEGTTPDDRTAFALTLRSGSEHYEVMVCDSATSPWKDVDILGTMLDRQQALAHALIQEVFHITNHMFEEDAPLKAYLDGSDDP
jgi:hypothetical protein